MKLWIWQRRRKVFFHLLIGETEEEALSLSRSSTTLLWAVFGEGRGTLTKSGTGLSLARKIPNSGRGKGWGWGLASDVVVDREAMLGDLVSESGSSVMEPAETPTTSLSLKCLSFLCRVSLLIGPKRHVPEPTSSLLLLLLPLLLLLLLLILLSFGDSPSLGDLSGDVEVEDDEAGENEMLGNQRIVARNHTWYQHTYIIYEYEFFFERKIKINGVDGEEGQIGRQARENQTLRGEGDSWKLWIFFNRKFGHGRCSSPCFFGLLVLIFGFGFFSLSFSFFLRGFFTTYFHAKREGCVHFER